MTLQNPLQLSEEQIDDLLYFARAGQTNDFLETLAEIKAATKFRDTETLLAARDEYSSNNVLHMTAGNGHLELTKTILSILPAPPTPDALPHTLLSHQNSSGNTPLHWAALNGHLDVVKILVMAANADPTITNNAGHDAVYEAELNDKKDVVDWLLMHCDNLEGGITRNVDGDRDDDNGRNEGVEEPSLIIEQKGEDKANGMGKKIETEMEKMDINVPQD